MKQIKEVHASQSSVEDVLRGFVPRSVFSAELAAAARAIDAGDNVVVAGLPASGKTMLLAAVAAAKPDVVAVSANNDAARQLTYLSSKMSSEPRSNMSQTFIGAVLDHYNRWRRNQHRHEVRRAPDDEVVTWLDVILDTMRPPSEILGEKAVDWASTSKSRTFKAALLDATFRLRSQQVLWDSHLASKPSKDAVRDWVGEVSQQLRDYVSDIDNSAGSHLWALDMASIYEGYLQALREGAECPPVVVLDDWQNSNGFMLEIVRQWALGGTQVVACGLPELAIDENRGGDGTNLATLYECFKTIKAKSSSVHYLRTSLAAPQLQETWLALVREMGVSGEFYPVWEPADASSRPDDCTAEQSAPLATPGNTAAAVQLVTANTDYAQYRRLGSLLLEAHIFDAEPLEWNQMAVLVNNSSVAGALKDQLSAMGIPVVDSTDTVIIKVGGMSGWLLRALEFICVENEADFSACQDFDLPKFLRSPLLRFSNAQLWKLDSELSDRKACNEASASADASGEEGRKIQESHAAQPLTIGLLPSIHDFASQVLAGEDPEQGEYALGEIAGAGADETQEDASGSEVQGNVTRLKNVLECLRQTREYWLNHRGSVQMLLWKLWTGLSNARELQERAVLGALEEPVREELNQELDLVMDLFEAANWHQIRKPEEDAAEFVSGMLSQTMPERTVALHHKPPVSVTITKASGAISRHWKLVAVAGVNQDQWPNLRWPGDGLNSTMFDLSGDTRSDAEKTHAGFDWARKREYRDFFAAISRATRRLIISATDGPEAKPSRFYTSLAERGIPVVDREENLPSDMRTMLALLRRRTMEGTPEQQHEAAQILAALRESLPEANPQNWMGTLEVTRGSSSEVSSESSSSNRPSAGVYRVRASQVQRMLDNPLDAILQSYGFDNPDDDGYSPQTLGNILHRAAEIVGRRNWDVSRPKYSPKNPMPREDILAELQRETEKILQHFQLEGWAAQNFRRQLDYRIKNLAGFMYCHQEPSCFETEYDTELSASNGKGKIRYRARIDRIMFTDAGPMIVDYKTGKAEKKDTPCNLQLALYQYAFNRNKQVDEPAAIGAMIVALKESRVKTGAACFEQGALDGDNALSELSKKYTGAHRLLLEDASEWLRKKRQGESDFGKGDPDKMRLRDFVDDRVNLLVSMLSHSSLAQISNPEQYPPPDLIRLDVERPNQASQIEAGRS